MTDCPPDIEASPATSAGQQSADSNETASQEIINSQRPSYFQKWSNIVGKIHQPILKALTHTSKHAASRPFWYIGTIFTVSVALGIVGITTNLSLVTDADDLWTPHNSLPIKHDKWVKSKESGFPQSGRPFQLIIHAGGKNVLSLEGVNRCFDAIDAVENTEGYDDLCKSSNGELKCTMNSVVSFWNENRTLFEETARNNDNAKLEMSALTFADGRPVDRTLIFGTPRPLLSDGDELLSSALSLITVIQLPPSKEAALSVENSAVDNILALNELWKEETENTFRVKVLAPMSYDNELVRAITQDLPLVAVSFIIMSVFCAFVLSKCDRIKSQGLLGLGAVLTVFLSLVAGYGIMMTAGVPLTSLTQIFPFILVGIGLDDAFILVDSMNRANPTLANSDMIDHIMRETGISISGTTLTTFVAFALGYTSAIPAVRWFTLYAAPTIVINFLYQVTFFVALMVLDKNRKVNQRHDCLFCIRSRLPTIMEENENQEQPKETSSSLMTTVMTRYSKVLLHRISKILVLVVFTGLLVVGILRACCIQQSFDFTEFIQEDSYVTRYFEASDIYSPESKLMFRAGVYFRDMDFSSNSTRASMDAYLEELVSLNYISSRQPTFYWHDDFTKFVSNRTIQGQPFQEQLSTFLSMDENEKKFGEDIVLDEHGNMVASRTFLIFDLVDRFDVEQQSEALLAQRDVTAEQSENAQSGDTWRMFTYGDIFFLWEFYSCIMMELIMNTILGITAVFIISLVFICNPVGSLLVTPTVAMIYVELLGFLELNGKSINCVTTIVLVMSIGLVVDYNLHIVQKYFELSDAGTSRNDCVSKVLETMGSSVMLGGLSTFLGVLTLSFSSSGVFQTFFVALLGVVVLGLTHGLIFMPVVLSILGPHKKNDGERSKCKENMCSEFTRTQSI